MKFSHKIRRNSTNVSEESDMCSEAEETIDVENDRDEPKIPRPSIALRIMRPELDTQDSDFDKDRRRSSKCSHHSPVCESNIAQRLMQPELSSDRTVVDETKNSLTKCSNSSTMYESKQITRPSFLITDILSDKKKQYDYDLSVPNTPTSISETLNKLDSHHRIEGVPHRAAAIIQSPTRSESPGYSEDENRDESSPSPTDHQHNLSNKAKKQRKARTAFSDHQLNSLEKSFERQKYLSVQDRMELAAKLNLSDTQVKTWYQNRRTKWKRQTAVGLELLAEAGNYATVQRMMQSSPYWGSTFRYAQAVNSGLLTNLDSLYYRHGISSLPSLSPQRMYMQSIGHISPH